VCTFGVALWWLGMYKLTCDMHRQPKNGTFFTCDREIWPWPPSLTYMVSWWTSTPNISVKDNLLQRLPSKHKDRQTYTHSVTITRSGPLRWSVKMSFKMLFKLNKEQKLAKLSVLVAVYSKQQVHKPDNIFVVESRKKLYFAGDFLC